MVNKKLIAWLHHRINIELVVIHQSYPLSEILNENFR